MMVGSDSKGVGNDSSLGTAATQSVSRGWRFQSLCCGAGEGEVCACLSKYRHAQVPEGFGSFQARHVDWRPLDLKSWYDSPDWVGYAMVPNDQPLSPEHREVIKQAVLKAWPNKRPITTFIQLPGVDALTGEWRELAMPLHALTNKVEEVDRLAALFSEAAFDKKIDMRKTVTEHMNSEECRKGGALVTEVTQGDYTWTLTGARQISDDEHYAVYTANNGSIHCIAVEPATFNRVNEYLESITQHAVETATAEQQEDFNIKTATESFAEKGYSWQQHPVLDGQDGVTQYVEYTDSDGIKHLIDKKAVDELCNEAKTDGFMEGFEFAHEYIDSDEEDQELEDAEDWDDSELNDCGPIEESKAKASSWAPSVLQGVTALSVLAALFPKQD